MLCSAMVLVGLTGGLATGKSTVARLFRERGAVVIDADLVARHVVEPGKPAWRDIVRTYGRGVLRADRTLNRQRLAQTVFRAPHKLRALNRIVHPRVAREQARLVREISRRTPDAVVIYDAPLLIEACAHGRMNKIIVVSTDQSTQISRLRNRNRLSRAEALRRIRTQIPLRQKRAFADYIIDGALPVRQLRRIIVRIYDELRERSVKSDMNRPASEPSADRSPNYVVFERL